MAKYHIKFYHTKINIDPELREGTRDTNSILEDIAEMRETA